LKKTDHNCPLQITRAVPPEDATSPAENFVFTFPVASEQPHLQSGLRDAPRVEMPGVSESK